MKWAWGLLAFGLCGCAGTTAVERYSVGSGDELEAAALEAARRLGWETKVIQPGTFRLVQPVFPLFSVRPEMEVQIGAEAHVGGEDGELSIRGFGNSSDDEGRVTLDPYGTF